ncbi:nicotinamide riboside transporter PnuC [Viridibacterium curvum]|uniref:Nicotinamide riboside transporter PnuC n=1 Tax=Viridibacterium curvum TaxID=1101404 RepID=A0ABP9QGV6_9RHOO
MAMDFLTTPVLTFMGMPMSWGDISGFATGIACVWLTARANVWNFPVGIANSAILGLVFLSQRLFADACLQVVFIVMSALGLYQWLHGHYAREDSPVFRVSVAVQLRLGAVAVVMTVLFWQVLLHVKGSAPFVDALITALSLCAQWLLNRRALESWWWWIVVDLISIPLYWSRELPLIAVLYVVFLLICVRGLLSWRKLVPAGEVVA